MICISCKEDPDVHNRCRSRACSFQIQKFGPTKTIQKAFDTMMQIWIPRGRYDIKQTLEINGGGHAVEGQKPMILDFHNKVDVGIRCHDIQD